MIDQDQGQAFHDQNWGPFEECPNSPFLDMGSGPEWDEVVKKSAERRTRQQLRSATLSEAAEMCRSLELLPGKRT